MLKEFWKDSYNNLVFKCTFKHHEDVENECLNLNGVTVYPLTSDRYGLIRTDDSDEHALQLSVNATMLKDTIVLMSKHGSSAKSVELYADCSGFSFGESHRVFIVREQDNGIGLRVELILRLKDSEHSDLISINMRPFMPLDLIDFLTEY